MFGQGERRKERKKSKNHPAFPSACPASPAAASRRPFASPRAWPTATRAMRGEEEKKECCREKDYWRSCRNERETERVEKPLPNPPLSLGLFPFCSERHRSERILASIHSVRTMQLTRHSKSRRQNDEKQKQKQNSAHAAGSAGASHDAVAATPWAQPPQCDICRCAPAMLLCTDDRAVMCRG